MAARTPELSLLNLPIILWELKKREKQPMPVFIFLKYNG